MSSNVRDNSQAEVDVFGLFPVANTISREAAMEVGKAENESEAASASAITLDDILGIREAVEIYTLGDGDIVSSLDIVDDINKIKEEIYISESSSSALTKSSFQLMKKASEVILEPNIINYPKLQNIDSPRDLLMRLVQVATVRIAELEAKTDGPVDLRPAQDRILDNPAVKGAVDKLLSLKGEIKYQTAKGRAAISAREWLRINLVESGRLTATELRLIPLNTFREFDIRLYQALANADRYAVK